MNFSGLFHGVIAQSGSALNLWAKPLNELQTSVAMGQASMVGCPTANTYELVDCLRKIDANKLLETGDLFKVGLKVLCYLQISRLIRTIY